MNIQCIVGSPEGKNFKNVSNLTHSTTAEPLGMDTSLIRTPVYYGQFPMSQQNSHIFFKKNLSLYYGLSLIRTMDTKSRLQRVNLYTAVSRKDVGRNAHETTPRGNMGCDQYTVRND